MLTAYSQTKKAAPTKAAPSKADPSGKMTDSPVQVDQDEINAKMMAAMTPGEAHNALARQEGEWTEEITIWTHDGAAPILNKAKVKIEMILGGRYQQGLHTGEFMGMPFEGVNLTGFDNITNKYCSTWIDNMGTGIMFSSGTMDTKTKSIQYYGEQADPISGKTIKIREIMTQISDGELHLDMYSTPLGGKEFRSMQIIMKR